MNELINRLKEITDLSEIENISNTNTNALLYAIAKSERYDLLKNSNIRLNISDNETLGKLTDFLLSDEDILYYMHKNGFSFSKEELNCMFNIVFQKYQYSYKFEYFFRDFFANIEELNNFVREHQQFFGTYLNEKTESFFGKLMECDNFVELILKGNNAKLVNNLENYSLPNLKLLSKFTIKNNNNISAYKGTDRFSYHLFELKESLEPEEFCSLLNLLKEKSLYDTKIRDSETTFFTTLVNENIDYLIEVVSQTKFIPKCLVESNAFRDECIKRNRIDLAIHCTLPPDIMKNESLINVYCSELGITSKDFYERSKWLLNYHEKNNNIFNTILATSLKDNIFNINKEHYERFINDIDIQMSISKLNDKELLILSNILNIYNYKEYDVSHMIVNIINNINNYQELVDSLDIQNVSEQDLRILVSVLQLPDNKYQINNLNHLHNYDVIKREHFINNFNLNNLESNKDELLRVLFNIDLDEAKYIDSKYCYEKNNNVLETLKNSELQPEVCNYLSLIDLIIKCDNINDLSVLYNNLRNDKIYDSEIALEPYLRAKYTELYSQSLYRIDERNKIYGPKDSISNEIMFNGKNIQVYIPRERFNFFVHCVGSCSLASDVVDENYKNDWLYRPQIQDHFVACSYINERGIYSIRSQDKIILGFDTLENGSILGMGNTDIDSTGPLARSYDGSRELQKQNANRATYFVPSELLKTVNDGYNEIVIERRNADQSKYEEFKRKPDYIIMMAESLEQDNFNYLENLYQNQLSFISKDDQNEITQIGSSYKLKNFLIKYNDIISQVANSQDVSLNDMTNMYVRLIMKAKYYEDCLKASSEFDIPLVIVDKTYYFNKILSESVSYYAETTSSISDFYSKADESKRKQMFNMVAKGVDVTQVMKPKEPSINL